ncbi:MAG: SDR family oxidoreductase [Phycisphaerae bacterium]
MPEGPLTGRVALVTGAARRVGRAIALKLADAGCDVAIHYHTSRSEAEAAAKRIRGIGRRTTLLQTDLTDAVAVEALPSRVVSELGRLDILINNAAIFERVPLEKLAAAAWQRALSVNLIAPALLARAAAPHLRKSGSGCIVNLTDILAERPEPAYLAYCAAKAALISLTRGLAAALAPHVRVNAVSPGVAEFPDDYDEAQRTRILQRVPMRRAGSPRDVAATVLFLVRDAGYVTGTVLSVDGGRGIAW